MKLFAEIDFGQFQKLLISFEGQELALICCEEISQTGVVLTRRLGRAEELLGYRHKILQRSSKKSQISNFKFQIPKFEFSEEVQDV